MYFPSGEAAFDVECDWTCEQCVFKELPFHIDDDDDVHETIDLADNNNDGSNLSQIYQTESHSYNSTVEEQFKSLSSLTGCKIAHLNVLSLLKNIDELKLMLRSSTIDILTV